MSTYAATTKCHVTVKLLATKILYGPMIYHNVHWLVADIVRGQLCLKKHLFIRPGTSARTYRAQNISCKHYRHSVHKKFSEKIVHKRLTTTS